MQSEMAKYGRQLGDILQVMEKGAGYLKDKYPIPAYYSGIDDIISDASLSRLEKRNLKKGWRANVIIGMPGELDDENVDENGKTDQDHFDSTVNNFTGEDAASVMVIWGRVPDGKPDVNIISLADILDATDKSTDRLTRKVCRLMEVPPVLIGMTTPGQLGNTQEIINLIKLFNLMVLKAQNRITRALSMIFPGIDWTINPTQCT